MKTKENLAGGFDLEHFLPYLLNQAAEVTSRSFQTVYREDYGMTRTQWRVMANLGKHGPMTASEICKSSFIEKTKMSRAVQGLEEHGFVLRNVVAGDRRSEKLSLTPSGKSAFRALGRKAILFDGELRKRLGTKVANDLEFILKNLMQKSD